MGRTADAESYHNMAYENKLKVLGLYNFETIDSINERGRILLSKKLHQEGKLCFQ
jgi:hypothetical protein